MIAKLHIRKPFEGGESIGATHLVQRPYEFVPGAGLETRTTAGQETGGTGTESCGQTPRSRSTIEELTA